MPRGGCGHDVLIAFLALHAVILATWWRWLTPRSAGLTDAERLMCAAVLGFAQIISVSLILGWFGVLAARPLVLLVAAGSVVLLLIPLRSTDANPRPDAGPRPASEPSAQRPAGRQADRQRRGRPADERVRSAAAPGIARANLVLIAILLPTLVLVAVRGVLAPNFGWDGLRYHLPMTAFMAQTGGFDYPSGHNPVIAAYPKEAEIWVHWMFAFLGDDRWLGLAQLPFLVLAMLAIYAAARRLGATGAAATTGALLFACAPLVMSQVTVGYNDVFLTAVLLVAVAVVLAARQSSAPALPLSFGAALGLLMGTKFPAVLFVAVLYAAFACVALGARGRRALPGLVLAAGIALLLGGDTYVRNWRQHDNPVYPYATEVLGVKLPGPLDEDAVYGVPQTRALPFWEPHYRSWTAFGATGESDLFGGFGAAAPVIAVILAISLVVAARRRDAPRLLLFALFALLFVLTPLNFRLRFVLYLVGLAGICLSDLLDRAAPIGRALLLVATGAAAMVTAVQLWPGEVEELRRLAGQRPDPCRVAPKSLVRPAYLWMREHAPPDSSVLVFPPPEGPFVYCLWTPTLSNRVEFADALDPAALERLAAERPDALFFVPLQSPIYRVLSRTDPRRWRLFFSNEAVMIVTPAAVPST
jgi:hypothetical protein